jgi:acetyl esterase/lipase
MSSTCGRIVGGLVIAVLVDTLALAQTPRAILLWPEGAPGAAGTSDADRPSLTVYPAARSPVPTGVVIAPGGGYGGLANDHEGRQIAAYFNAMGIHAFVLRYRLGPKYRHPTQLGDATRAMRYVRAMADELKIAPDRIGLMGFSAGGHLAATTATLSNDGRADDPDPIERVRSRPDFLILGYPVISFDPAIAHMGSRRNLLGDTPEPEVVTLLSAENQVTANTPPTFLFHTTADAAVPAENSIRFYLALRAAKVPVELHVFENGPHGVGLALGDPALGVWPTLLTNWMRGRGLLSRP